MEYAQVSRNLIRGRAGIGAILNPLNLRESATALAAILSDSGSVTVIADDDFAPLLLEARARGAPSRTLVGSGAVPSDGGEGVRVVAYEELLASASPVLEDPHPTGASTVAHLYFTSGTTGRAKGVMLTHGNVEFHARAAVAELGLAPSDTWGHIAPLFHLADAWAVFAVTIAGGRTTAFLDSKPVRSSLRCRRKSPSRISFPSCSTLS
jgi:acyl-coenzyme A synthetase/AMP-(fatty) acid ligase